MNEPAVLLEKKNGVATITLNQPKSMNSLVQPVIDGLDDALERIKNDDEVKVVILTGAGRAFCAGGDLNRFTEGFDAISGLDYVDNIHPVMKTLATLKKPTIAAVNGAAVGAGLSLMLLCDMAYLADTAKVGCAFVNMGLIPDCALAYYLPRVVGIQKAKELVFTGRTLSAGEAGQVGLTNGVYPADELLGRVTALAERLAAGPSFTLRLAKRMLGMSLDMDFNNLLTLEAMMQSTCFMTEDSKEAVAAFLEKRKPQFKGR